jgi:glycosyltransferase involved in cell wall biosynthesis
LSAADICVDPDPANAYNDRSTMIKIMEYMAFEKPIVAFDLPEHRVTAREAAVYVTPNDEHAFAVALARLMDDAVARKSMGASGRRRIETELAWRFSVVNLLEVYRKVLPDSGIARELVVSEATELRKQNLSSRQAAV